MKKLLLFTLAFSIQHSALVFAGTNAAVTFNTNTYVVSPTNLWRTNAVAIQSALQAIGFSGGGTNGGTTNFFDPAQMLTNVNGQVHVFSLPTPIFGPFAITNTNNGNNLFINTNGDVTNSGSLYIGSNINVTGTVTAGAVYGTSYTGGIMSLAGAISGLSFAGDGSAITGINAGHITSGTIPNARINASTLIDGTKYIASTNGTAFGTLANTNAPWNHVSTTYGWLDKSNGVVMAYESNGVFYSVGLATSNLNVLSNAMIGTIQSGGLSGVVTLTNAGAFQSDWSSFPQIQSDGDGNLTAESFTISDGGLNFTGDGGGLYGIDAGGLRNTINSNVLNAANAYGLTSVRAMISTNVVSGIAITNAAMTSATITGSTLNQFTLAGGTNTLTGSWAIPATSITSLASGENADIPIGTNSYFILSGPTAAFAVDGLVAAAEGRDIRIVNPTGYTMTVRNNSGIEPTPANRIITGVNGDLIFTNNPAVVNLHYTTSSNAWIVTGINALSVAALPAAIPETNIAWAIPVFTNFGTVAFNTYYTNTWNRISEVSVNFTLPTTGAYQDAIYLFDTNAVNAGITIPPRQISPRGYAGGAIQTITFKLYPWEYFSITNLDSAASSISTNSVELE
jgi:hypothetical protein